jgi:hypothetical protein
MFTQALSLRCFAASMEFSIVHAHLKLEPGPNSADWRGATLRGISGNFFMRGRKSRTVENKTRLIRRCIRYSCASRARLACFSRISYARFARRHAKYKIRRGQETQKWFSWILQTRVSVRRHRVIRCASLSKSCFGIIAWDRKRDSYR